MSDIKILALDIETRPMLAYRWSLWDKFTPINQVSERSGTICFAARWAHEPKRNIKFFSDFTHGHDGMLEAAWELIDEADALMSWNGIKFDLRKLNKEFIVADLGRPSPVFELDLMVQLKKVAAFDSNKLDWVSQELGIGKKMSHAGFSLWLRCLAGDAKAWAEMEKYNKQDVHLLVDIYKRVLPWLKLPNQNLWNVVNGCPTPDCKGAPQKRGFRTTQIGVFQRYHCSECRRWFSSGKSIERSDLRGV